MFEPLGLWGLAYWYGVWPLHQLVFAGMLRGIAHAAEERNEHSPSERATGPGSATRFSGTAIGPARKTPAAIPASGARRYLALAGWLLACFAAASLGGVFMPGEWYAALKKPAWNPPGWIFGPVWTALYTMMAVAAWLVWQRGGFVSQRRPLTLFLAQLALNAAWTPLFFGLHFPGLAFAELMLLWAAIAATLASFRGVSRAASWLFAPYLAWVSFAAALNFALWRLNAGAISL
jgi:tryptophan-rich sensory protein